jgi:spermidine/putrescine-binding protein
MTAHFKVDRWVRLMLSSVWVITLTACSMGGNSDSTDGLVTSSGFVCPQPEPRIEFESDTINIYTWTEYMPVDITECFGLVYDVDVMVDYFSSNEELYSKVSLGSGTTLYDVIHPSDYMIGVLIREELLQELDYSRIPNLLNLDANLTVSYGASTKYLVPYQMGTQGILYNSKAVDTPPTSWADLWNPEYEGRIVAVDDNRVVIGAALLSLGYSVNDTAPDHLEEAKEKLIELMPNIYVFDSDNPRDFLIAGDADLGILWNGEAFLAQTEDPRFEYVFPDEGSIIFYDGMAIPNTAPHSDAAYAWFNYLLQGNVNWLALVDYPYTNPNKAALEYARVNQPEVYDAYISSPITNTPAEEFKKGHEVLDLGAALLLYDELWMEINP